MHPLEAVPPNSYCKQREYATPNQGARGWGTKRGRGRGKGRGYKNLSAPRYSRESRVDGLGRGVMPLSYEATTQYSQTAPSLMHSHGSYPSQSSDSFQSNQFEQGYHPSSMDFRVDQLWTVMSHSHELAASSEQSESSFPYQNGHYFPESVPFQPNQYQQESYFSPEPDSRIPFLQASLSQHSPITSSSTPQNTSYSPDLTVVSTSSKRLEPSSGLNSSADFEDTKRQRRATDYDQEKLHELIKIEESLSNKVKQAKTKEEKKELYNQYLKASRTRVRWQSTIHQKNLNAQKQTLFLLKEENERLRTANQQLTFKLSYLEVDLKTANTSLAGIQEDNSKLNFDLNNLSMKLLESQSHVTPLLQRIEELKNFHQNLYGEKEMNEREISRLQDECRALQQKLESKDVDSQKISADLEAKDLQIAALDRSNCELTAALSQIKEDLGKKTAALEKLTRLDKAKTEAISNITLELGKLSDDF